MGGHEVGEVRDRGGGGKEDRKERGGRGMEGGIWCTQKIKSISLRIQSN